MLLRVVEKAAHHAYRVGQGLTIGLGEALQIRIDHRTAVGADVGKHGDALRGDADQNRPRVGGIGDPRDQAGELEAADLCGHGRLRAVIQCGEIGDPCGVLVLDHRQQAGLGERQLHPDTLGGQPVDSGDHGQQVRR